MWREIKGGYYRCRVIVMFSPCWIFTGDNSHETPSWTDSSLKVRHVERDQCRPLQV